MSDAVDRVSAVLATTARRWRDLTETVPEDVLERPAAAGEWSAVDCLRHQVTADRHVLPARVRQFLAGVEELPPINPAELTVPTERTARELAEAFARVRAENLAMIAALRPDDLARTATSRRLGPVTLEHMLYQWAIHDLEHVLQAERALMQALLVDSGPVRTAYAAFDQEAAATSTGG